MPLSLPEKSLFKEGSRIEWQCAHLDFIMFLRYLDIFEPKPAILDIWECQEKDRVLITTDSEEIPEELRSSETGPGFMKLWPGDRILWVGHSRKRGTPGDLGYCILGFIESRDEGAALGVLNDQVITEEGFPIPFGTLTVESPPPAIKEAYSLAVHLGIPRVWAPAGGENG